MTEPRLQAQLRPGHLTSVMRAVQPPTGPRVLRIAIVQEGKVIEERTFEPRAKVTIGPKETDTFVVVGASLAASAKLFEPVAKGYRLDVPRGAKGRIAEGPRLVAVHELQGRSIVISEDARGKIVLGDTTVLFSFAPAAARAMPAQLPESIRRGLDVDWSLTIIAAASFLFHFGMLGSLYSDWADPVVDDRITVAKLVETVRELPKPPPIEVVQKDEAAPDTTATPTSVAKTEPKSDAKVANSKSDRPAKTDAAKRMSDAAAANIMDDLAQMNIEMAGVLNSHAPSIDRVLRDSDLPLSQLDDAARRNAAISTNPNRLDLGKGGRTHRPGETGDSLADLGNSGKDDAAATSGTQKKTKVTGNAQEEKCVGATCQPPPSEVPDAPKVIGGLYGGFRRCYEAGLNGENPDMEGTIRVTAKVGPNGEVTSATPTVSGSLSGGVVSCVVGKIKGAQFSPPTNGVGAVLMIPVTLKKQ
jgi:hypothetical protein